MPLLTRLSACWRLTTPAVGVLLGLWAVSSYGVLSCPARDDSRLVLWVFAKIHAEAYQQLLPKWNDRQEHIEQNFEVVLLQTLAIERRLQSGFMTGTPVADLVEVDMFCAAKALAAPTEAIGFMDLTDRLQSEGILATINAPSLAPWTSRGRVYGLPHDVHPVLLAYRSDLTEAAGIDLEKVETWDEFFAALRPLMRDLDGDGRVDRYPLNFTLSQRDLVECLLLQAGGGIFAESGELNMASERNAEVLSRLAVWAEGPSRVFLDAQEANATGNALRLQGAVIANLMPDWLAGVWRHDLPGLSGKMKLMPLPAWEKGGRRTSVYGGTMLGVPRATRDFETAWAFAKELYVNPEMHAELFLRNHIIPPFKTSWTHPAFATPNPYFCGQQSGLLYIAQAAYVPTRSSSPFNETASLRMAEVGMALVERVKRERITDPSLLLPEARARLATVQAAVARQMARNVLARENNPGSNPVSVVNAWATP
jgi:arabinosaccharide transport system substrate-binding protein